MVVYYLGLLSVFSSKRDKKEEIQKLGNVREHVMRKEKKKINTKKTT